MLFRSVSQSRYGFQGLQGLQGLQGIQGIQGASGGGGGDTSTYTPEQIDASFVFKQGDTMTGALKIDASILANNYYLYGDTVSTNMRGIIYKDSSTFIMEYRNSATSSGPNLIIGVNSGNIKDAARLTSQHINNMAIGNNVLSKLTTGYSNVGIGNNSLQSTTTAIGNLAIGFEALQLNNVGGYNVAIGPAAHKQGGGSYNTTVGYAAKLKGSTNNNVAIGYSAVHDSYNSPGLTGVGYKALFLNNSGSYSAAYASVS